MTATSVGSTFAGRLLDLPAGLPDPAVRYLRFALSPDQRPIRSARVAQSGTFLVRAPDGWAPFTAVEHFTANPPSFVWTARIRMAPFVVTHVRDSYENGEGAMVAKVGHLFTLAEQHGTLEISSAALLRWLAEAPWLPTALMPSDRLVWQPVDHLTSRITLEDRGLAVSVDVDVSERGEITRISADRYRDIDGVGVLTPWVGWFRDYESVDGMMVPKAAEVAWIEDDEAMAYFRCHVDHVEYVYG